MCWRGRGCDGIEKQAVEHSDDRWLGFLISDCAGVTDTSFQPVRERFLGNRAGDTGRYAGEGLGDGRVPGGEVHWDGGVEKVVVTVEGEVE